MDKLSTAEQAELKKCSTERLIQRLTTAGWAQEGVSIMDRHALLNAVAELNVEPVGATAKGIKPIAIWEQELELRRAELAAREEERRREMDFRAAEVMRHEEIRAAEERRWTAEMQFREDEARRQQEFRLAELNYRQLNREDEKSLISQTKKYGMALKNIFPSMPTDSAELPSYLENVDNMFALYEVPKNLRSHLLLSALTGKAKSIVSKLPLSQLADYDIIRQCLLREFQVTPRELRSRFQGATKRTDKSYSVFRARLEVSLTHYLKSRSVDSYQKLMDIITADKLKDTLSPGALRYVLGLEGDECYTSHKVANAADIYCSNYNADGSYKADSITSLSLHGASASKFNSSYKNKSAATPHSGGKNFVVHNENIGNKDAEIKSNFVREFHNKGVKQPFKKDDKPFVKRACYVCGSEQHLASSCAKRASANSCVSRPSESMSSTEGVGPNTVINSVDISAVNCERNECVFETDVCYESKSCITSNRQRPMDFDGAYTACDTVYNYDCDVSDVPEVHLSPLNYIDVVISGNVYKALIDSGAELPLIKSSLVKDVSCIGNINIQPIVGKAVPANLAVFDVARFDNSVEDCDNLKGDRCNSQRPLHLVFAVTDLATHDVVLPASIVRDLSETSHKSTALCKDSESSINVCSINVDCLHTVVNDNVSDDNEDIVNVDQLTTDNVNIPNISDPIAHSSREQLIRDQMSDDSLKSSRSLADRKRGGYRWIDGILFHHDKVLNQSVTQIVVPSNRRANIMSFAHENNFHQGHKKTSERIRYSFFGLLCVQMLFIMWLLVSLVFANVD
jgi:hypothetical protein